MTKPLILSIVVPCYNESENIPGLLERFKECTKEFKEEFELILVDNNSKDNTKEILKQLLEKREYSFAKSVLQPIPGYGAAISKGLETCKGKFICWTHADLQTDPSDCFKALDIARKNENPDKVYIKGKRYGRALFDSFFTLGMSIFETLTLRKGLYDINAQPNLVESSFLKITKEIPLDFSIDLYMYYMAKKNKYKIIRFPVYFGKRIHGESSWNTGMKARFKLIKRTLSFSFEMKKKLKETT